MFGRRRQLRSDWPHNCKVVVPPRFPQDFAMPPLKARGGNLIEPSRHGSACGMSDERSVYGDLGGVVWLVWPGDELHLRTPPRRRHRWIGRRQPEVLKNGLDRAVFGGP